MNIIKQPLTTSFISKAILLIALTLLAYEPFLWLINTWRDDAYDSMGAWAFVATFVLLLWSVTSPLKSPIHTHQRIALGLLAATALTRLIGQVLAINIIGALALVIDIYAIALWLGVSQRKRAISAEWLAVLFVFALPIERVIQRVAGYGLQELSSFSACQILSFGDNVVCQGTRIAVAGRQFIIDLPCTGTNTLVILSVVMIVGMVITKPRLNQSLVALSLVIFAAWLSNVIRILLLVSGATSPLLLAIGIDVMMQPWHDIVGLIALLPFLWIVLYFCFRVAKHNRHDSLQTTYVNKIKKPTKIKPTISLILSAIFLVLAVLTVNLPRQAMDIQQTSALQSLPAMLEGEYAQPIALLEKEQAYFTQFGGDARKAIYGERQLLLTKTSSPLRHLHAPDECLRGLGFSVSYIGTIDEPVATAIYKAISPDGKVWKIAVSFISNQGDKASNVSEAVWQWFKQPQTQWYSLQRISPWHTDFDADRRWDRSVLNAITELSYEK